MQRFQNVEHLTETWSFPTPFPYAKKRRHVLNFTIGGTPNLCFNGGKELIRIAMDTIINKLPSNLPLIAIIETERAHIIIEKTPVAEYGEYDFINFVKVIINYYFVLNKMYPAEISQTLEFLTRFCYKHYPNQPQNINSLQKVNNLISKISNV
ncbi:uncharacterized protein [Eurosta solidaginis]|uniref:uncharacterized protein isoform X2 n=1 Tax=Eurosta solidaginis TaxID=178769 RepID=UPI003530A84E